MRLSSAKITVRQADYALGPSISGRLYQVGGNGLLSKTLARDPDGQYPDTVLCDTDANSTDEEIIHRFGRPRNDPRVRSGTFRALA
jgi:hypothetical protein